MKKGWISLFLGAAVLFSFAACTPVPNVGVDSSGLDPFVIGGIGPLTEDRAPYGISVKNGAQIAVDEINATGGVNGFRLVLNFQDSKGDPKIVQTVYDKLKNNDMQVLLGGVFSEETEALAPLAGQDGILTVTPTASRPEILGEKGNLFRVCFDDARLGTMIANFIADQNLATRVAVVWSDDVFGGRAQAEAFLSTFTLRGGEADLYELPSEGVKDLEAVAAALELHPVEMIYLALPPADAQELLREMEWDGTVASRKVIGASGVEGLLEASEAPTLLEGMMVATSFAADDPSVLVQNFVTSYTKAYQQTPDRYAADAYDAVYAIAAAIKRAGITPENVDDEDFNGKMISAMTQISVRGVTGTMSWTPNGETTRPASVKVIRSGKYGSFVKEEG